MLSEATLLHCLLAGGECVKKSGWRPAVTQMRNKMMPPLPPRLRRADAVTGEAPLEGLPKGRIEKRLCHPDHKRGLRLGVRPCREFIVGATVRNGAPLCICRLVASCDGQVDGLLNGHRCARFLVLSSSSV